MSKKTQKQERSPAYRLIEHVWVNQGHGMGRSRERSGHAMSAALALAVRFGLRFDIDDMSHLAAGANYEPFCYAGEYDYALACGSERGLFNNSAAMSFEAWKDRKPFKIEEPHSNTPTRIYVGREFGWQGEYVTCTSFAADGSYLTACEYHPRKKGSYENKVKRRHKITVADIIADRRKRREWEKEQQQRDELADRLDAAVGSKTTPKVVAAMRRRLEKATGVKTRKQWDEMPIEKLTEAVERFLEKESKKKK